MTYEPCKLGRTDLVLVCDQSLSVGLCMPDYKPLRAAVTICATVVNTQTHRQTGTKRGGKMYFLLFNSCAKFHTQICTRC